MDISILSNLFLTASIIVLFFINMFLFSRELSSVEGMGSGRTDEHSTLLEMLLCKCGRCYLCGGFGRQGQDGSVQGRARIHVGGSFVDGRGEERKEETGIGLREQ